MNIKNTMIKRIILLKLVLCNIVFCTIAQDTIPYSIPKLYGFESIEKDSISNSKELDKVFETLYLTKKLAHKTSFFHLGDSHLQADYISHTIRTELHKKFGNAGRGLITPLKIAKTNEPFNYLTESKNIWKRQLIISKKINQPIGITGLSILSKDTIGSIKIKTFDTDSINYSYNTIRVFNDPDSSFTLSISDSLNEWQGVNNLNAEPTFNSIKSNNTVFLNFSKRGINQNKVLIYGFSVENNKPGILYHSTGINGAKYSDYNKPTQFTNQIKKLNPDLMILSLGTNESFLPNYDSTSFYLTIDSLINKIKIELPNINLILTTPACSFKYNKKNVNLTSVSKTIVKYAIKNQLPYWDLFEITGGENSANNWKKNLLLNRDGVHYTKQGYILQGQLFVLAFLKGYNQYVKHRLQ